MGLKMRDRGSKDASSDRFGRSATFKVVSGLVGVLILSVVGVSTSMVSADSSYRQIVCILSLEEKNLAMVTYSNNGFFEACEKFFFQDGGNRHFFEAVTTCPYVGEDFCHPFLDGSSFYNEETGKSNPSCFVEAKNAPGSYRVKWPCAQKFDPIQLESRGTSVETGP